MMDLDEAIQHCKEQVQEQAKRGCYSCAEEHQQLVEWLKELKEYREQRGERMNEAEKERLIKKDIASIENRVRHAFNQGYEMGLKESSSENPNTCGDAISRQAVLDGLASIAKTKAKSDAQKSLMGRVMFFTEQLPSVTPQQRIGADVLDKIRAEIESVIQEETVIVHPEARNGYERIVSKLDPDDVFQIIDKYKAESEE